MSPAGGDRSAPPSREAIADLLRATYPDDSDARVQTQAAQLYAFVRRVKRDDLIVLPLKTRAQIAIGRVTGPYQHRPDLGEGATHTRPVVWLRPDVPRTTFGQDLLYSFGAFLTVCQVRRNDAESPADVRVLREPQGSMQTFKADQGLLVSWGGLNGPADREARHNHFAVRVWDGKELLRAVFRNYEKLSKDVQAELPLNPVWALVPSRLGT